MASLQIPADFLLEVPPNASMRKIDFMYTSPPIPAFKNHYAAVVDNFMTKDECEQLLRLAEEAAEVGRPDSHSSPIWERAMVNAGNGKEVLLVDYRNCGRIIWDSHDLGQRLLNRLMPFLHEFNIHRINNQPILTGLGPATRGEVFHLTQLNERLRFLRYEGGEYFRPHCDGTYITPDGSERSLFTIHLYLSGDGEQDLEELRREIEQAERRDGLYEHHNVEIDLKELASDVDKAKNKSRELFTASTRPSDQAETLLGGTTSFLAGKKAVRIFPTAGSVLIFQQRDMFHGGDDVFRGVKYTMRTDIMYRKETNDVGESF